MRLDTAVEILSRAIITWSPEDIRRLAAVVAIGAPSALHGDTSGLPAERDLDPGGVGAARAVSTERALFAADVLHVYRTAGRIAGVPLPPPGQLGGKLP